MNKFTKVLAFIAFTILSIVLYLPGLYFSYPVGIMGIPNTPIARLIGYVLIGAGIFFTFYSFSFFKEKKKGQLEVTSSIKNKVLIILPAAIVGFFAFYLNYGMYWKEQQSISNSQRKILNGVPFNLYNPTYIPSGYKLRETRVEKAPNYFFYQEYRDLNNNYFFISQYKKPENTQLLPPACKISGSSFQISEFSDTTSYINSICKETISPKKQRVYIMKYNITSEKNYAALLIDNTLITIAAYKFSDDEVINIFDSLENKMPTIKGPNMKEYTF